MTEASRYSNSNLLDILVRGYCCLSLCHVPSIVLWSPSDHQAVVQLKDLIH